MILIKLKTPFEKLYQNGLETKVVTCEYISATIENYQLGNAEFNFYYKLGKLEFDNEGNPIEFKQVVSGYSVINEKDLVDWGADDFKAIEILAEKLNLILDDSPESRINAPKLLFHS